MDQATQTDLVRRALAALEPGAPPEAPRDTTVDVEPYRSPTRFADERRAVFRRVPLAVAHASELAAPGDTVAVDVGELPLLVTRDARGALHAFFNVCRHRGARLVCDGGGPGRKAFTCRYHAWTYDLAGALLHVPQADAFPRLDHAAAGLVRLPVAVAGGFVFVLPTPDAPLDPATLLGPFGADLDGFALGAHTVFRTSRTRRRTNWKLVADAFLEGYHVKSLHRSTLYRFFRDDVMVTDTAPPHVRSAGARRTLADARALPPDAWRAREHLTVFYLLFPNSIVVLHPDSVSHVALHPVAVDETEVVHRLLVPSPPTSDAERAHHDRTWALIDEQVFGAEDLAIAESIQAGLASGALDRFHVGHLETPIRAFHDTLARAVADDGRKRQEGVTPSGRGGGARRARGGSR